MSTRNPVGVICIAVGTRRCRVGLCQRENASGVFYIDPPSRGWRCADLNEKVALVGLEKWPRLVGIDEKPRWRFLHSRPLLVHVDENPVGVFCLPPPIPRVRVDLAKKSCADEKPLWRFPQYRCYCDGGIAWAVQDPQYHQR